MAIYKETIKITYRRSQYIKRCIKKHILGIDDVEFESAFFPNGIVIDIKCCGSSCEDEGAWCEAVMLEPDSKHPDSVLNDTGISIIQDNFLGKWELSDGTDTYIVSVVQKPKTTRKSTK